MQPRSSNSPVNFTFLLSCTSPTSFSDVTSLYSECLIIRFTGTSTGFAPSLTESRKSRSPSRTNVLQQNHDHNYLIDHLFIEETAQSERIILDQKAQQDERYFTNVVNMTCFSFFLRFSLKDLWIKSY